MAGSDEGSELHFDSPGPGTWELDAVHFPRPVTRYWADTHPEAAGRGTREIPRVITGCSSAAWKWRT